MCKPASEGGQRCASHARKAYDRAAVRHAKAIKAHDAAIADGAPPAQIEKLRQARLQSDADRLVRMIEFASTPTGAAKLTARRDDLIRLGAHQRPDGATRVNEYEMALRKGAELREKNKAVAAALKAAQTAPNDCVAVCDACGWEGPEDQAPSGHCPQCKQDQVNYFYPAPETPYGAPTPAPKNPNPNEVPLNNIEPGETFYWDGDIHVLESIEDDPDDPDAWLVETASMNLTIPKDHLVERLEDEPEPWEPTNAQIDAWVRDDEAQVAGDPT